MLGTRGAVHAALMVSVALASCAVRTSSRGFEDDGGGTGGAAGSMHGPGDDAGSAGSEASTAGDDASTGAFDSFQEHNVEVLNSYRAQLGAPPLVLDGAVCAFAAAGSTELSQDHSPHAHFLTAMNSGAIWNDGFATVAGENQGDPSGWPVLDPDPTRNEMSQIDAILKEMFDEGPGQGEAHAHYTNIVDPRFRRLGAGLLEIGGHLYLTNDFTD
jgi:hypothetical protein